MKGIAWWYCCLNPREAAVLRATSSYMVVVGTPWVPLDVWLSFWVPFAFSGAAVRDAFLTIYGLEIATIVDPVTEQPVEVVLPVWSEWSGEWELYLMSSASFCLEGCTQSKLPWQT